MWSDDEPFKSPVVYFGQLTGEVASVSTLTAVFKARHICFFSISSLEPSRLEMAANQEPITSTFQSVKSITFSGLGLHA